MDIWFATNNIHKKKELEAVLGVNLKIPKDAGIEFDPDETGTSFCENALLKARELRRLLNDKNDLVIADDSGLCVDALGGKPGVLSARYGDRDGKKLSGTEKNLLLLDELKDSGKRSARFVCAMVLLIGDERFFIVQETAEGEIVRKSGIRGDGGFGYDPVFLIPELNRTMAELSEEEKNDLSHRGKAGKQIADILKNLTSGR